MRKTEQVYRGNEWVFDINIVDPSTGSAMDCTGLDSVMVVKRRNAVSAPEIVSKYISWVDNNPANGVGYYVFNPVLTRDVRPGVYHYEVYLVSDTGYYIETLEKGKLRVLPTLRQVVTAR